MSDVRADLVEQLHREAVLDGPLRAIPDETVTVHHSDLPEAHPNSPLHLEWNTYRREAARLLANANENRYVLIKGGQIIGLWDTADEALGTGYRLFLDQPFLVHKVQEREQVLRCTAQWRDSPSRFGLAS